ncbi:MAG: hypothetical protein EBR82_70750 [Caulobacteraceae bacterium]|nr:hypothetical protein [Caulobacteraceae bacterium]NDG26421.1 hypothetical protein [Pseudomonadota bacterium]
MNYSEFYQIDPVTKHRLETISELKSLLEYRSAFANCARPKLSLDLGELKEPVLTYPQTYVDALEAARKAKLEAIDSRIDFLTSLITKGEVT